MMKQIKTVLILFSVLTVLTGVVYPLGVTALAQMLFPFQANGSLVMQNGQVAGSHLIGQDFTQPQYFWGRPSATPGTPYNASASGGSNLGPTNPEFFKQVQERIAVLRAADPGNTQPVPVELVNTSASGLDPDISVAAARYQAGRVAGTRGLEKSAVLALIDANTTAPFLGLLGETRVNVLQLNRALDELK